MIKSLLPNAPPLYEHQETALEFLYSKLITMGLLPQCYMGLFQDEAFNALCLTAPTGSGKSRIEQELHQAVKDSFLISPSVEVIAGILHKLTGIETSALSEAKFRALCAEHRIGTPITVRNRLAEGVMKLPSFWIIDELHHASAESYQLVRAMCNAPTVGFTATGFRGSAKETIRWRELWDDVIEILSYPEAAQRKVISIPRLTLLPLADDDICTVANGEIEVASASELVQNRLDDLVQHSVQYVNRGVYEGSQFCSASRTCPENCSLHGEHAGRWDRPTVYAMPSTECVRTLVEKLNLAGCPAREITQSTSWRDRQDILKACIECRVAIVQINVLTEGVDFTFRRLIDSAPTLSPVKALQLWGRVMRPWDQQPELICTCRNFERHLYLLQGCVPIEKVKEAQEVFGGVSKRAGSRVVGLESVGRFKAVQLPLADGSRGLAYFLQSVDGLVVTQWAILQHPAGGDPIVAKKTNYRLEDGRTDYGKWERHDGLPNIEQGTASSMPKGPMSPGQAAWWKKEALSRGLDVTVDVDKRVFSALPVLSNLRLRLRA